MNNEIAINGEINGVPVVDPEFLKNLNKNLPANQEIRVKRIYHVNKPDGEPEPEAEEPIENDDDEISNHDGLSLASNPASVVRNDIKIRRPIQILAPPIQYHPMAPMIYPYPNMHPYPVINPYLQPTPCRICNSNARSFDQQPIRVINSRISPHTIISPHPHPIYYQYPSTPNINIVDTQNKQNPTNNNKAFLPAINFPKHNPTFDYKKDVYNRYNTIPINRGNENQNKTYTDLFQKRNKLVDYAYNKYSPQKSDKNDTSQGKTVQLYKSPENQMY